MATITPRLWGEGLHRIALKLSPADARRFNAALNSRGPAPGGRPGRSTRWEVFVTDLVSGRKYQVRGASCGLLCRCDAVARAVR